MTMTGMRMAMAAAMMAILVPVAARPETPDDRKEATRMAAMVDADHDGRVTRAEMQGFGIRHGLGSLVNPRTWKKADSDGDGALSVPELSTYLLDVRARRMAKRR